MKNLKIFKFFDQKFENLIKKKFFFKNYLQAGIDAMLAYNDVNALIHF